MQKRLLMIGVLVFILLLGGLGVMLRTKESSTVSQFTASSTLRLITSTTTAVIRGQCLEEGEEAGYPLSETKSRLLGYPKELPLIISINNTNGLPKRTHFKIDDVYLTGYPIQVRKCGVYVIREFNRDPIYMGTHSDHNVGWYSELWKYGYHGEGKILFRLVEKTPTFEAFYDTDFRISPTERSVALTRAFPGKPDFALMLKNLTTLKDDYVFPVDALFTKHPELLNSLMLNSWSSDGRYFWAQTHDAAVTLALIRIDTTTGNAEVFPAPPDVLGGDAFNPDTGDITQHPGNFWSADSEYDAEVRTAREAKGEGTDLYLHNVVSGKRILVAHSPYAVQYFRPRWISTTTLEYFMPTIDGEKGERREFVVE